MQFRDVLFQIRMVWSSEHESYTAHSAVFRESKNDPRTIQGIS